MEICALYLRCSVECLPLLSQYSCQVKRLLARYSNYTFISQICFQLRENWFCLGASKYFKLQGDSLEYTDEQLPPLNHVLYATAPMNNVYASQHYKTKQCYISLVQVTWRYWDPWEKGKNIATILTQMSITGQHDHSKGAFSLSNMGRLHEEVWVSAGNCTLPFIITEKK